MSIYNGYIMLKLIQLLISSGLLGRHHLVVRFLRDDLRMRPAAHPIVPTWELTVVLEWVSQAPFECIMCQRSFLY